MLLLSITAAKRMTAQASGQSKRLSRFRCSSPAARVSIRCSSSARRRWRGALALRASRGLAARKKFSLSPPRLPRFFAALARHTAACCALLESRARLDDDRRGPAAAVSAMTPHSPHGHPPQLDVSNRVKKALPPSFYRVTASARCEARRRSRAIVKRWEVAGARRRW